MKKIARVPSALESMCQQRFREARAVNIEHEPENVVIALSPRGGDAFNTISDRLEATATRSTS